MAAMDFVPDPRSPEDYARFMELATGYVEVSSSPLVRVIGIGQQAEDAGIRVELIAMEIRELGAILYWKAYTFEEGLLGEPVVTMSDDRGRSYTSLPMGGGGGGYRWKGETGIQPAPDTEARMLQVSIHGFEGFPPGFPGVPSTSGVDGHWAFELDLVG